MGGDGGSIPGRQDLVRTKRKPEKADQNMERVARWHHCAITQERLREPIVACELGRLYNKEAVLEYLLDKSTCDITLHIKSLKDVKQLNLTPNPAYKGKGVDKGDSYTDRHTAPYICPVTGLEMNGKYRFCFIWTCGCAMSEKALKEVKSEVCHKCGKEFSVDNGILINGTDEDVKILEEKMERRRAAAKAEKKAKKAQKRKQEPESTAETTTSSGTKGPTTQQTETATNGLDKKFVAAKEDQASSSGVANGNGAPSRSHSKQLDTAATRPEYNSKDSKVYKSLFLSKNKKDGDSAHWVTYNPYYAMRN